jgi:hypothetical protein
MYDSAVAKYGTRQRAGGTEDTAGPADRLEFLPIAELCAQVDKAGPRRFLLRGIWPAGDYGVHAAEMKAQKTWNTADLAVSVASGTPWLGAIPVDQRGPVLMLAGEGGKAPVVRRLRAICASRGLHLEDLPITICVRAPNLGNLAHLAQVQEAVTGASPRLVTLDPLYLSAGNASAGQLYEMGVMLGRIQRLCEDAAAALFVVTHFNRKSGAGAQRITGAGPAEWGRVLITATIMSSHTDPITKATTKLARLDVIGGEIPDQSIRVHRVIRAGDPDDMNSALHYETTVLDGTEDGTEDGMPPGKANLLAALRADPATPRTLPQLVDWIVNVHRGLPLKRTTGSEYLNELAKEGHADCIDQGPGRAKLWYAPEGVSDDASASLPAGGLTPAGDPSSASSPYGDDDGSAGELTGPRPGESHLGYAQRLRRERASHG